LPGSREEQVNPAIVEPGEAMELRGGQPRQHRAITGAKNRHPEPLLIGQRSRLRDKNPGPHPLPPATGPSPAHGRVAEMLKGRAESEHARLRSAQLSEVGVTSLETRAMTQPSRSAACHAAHPRSLWITAPRTGSRWKTRQKSVQSVLLRRHGLHTF